MFAKFEKHSLKTVRRIDYTNSIPYSAKKAAKKTKFKRPQFSQIIYRAIKNPPAYLHYVHNKYARFQKDTLKTVGGVDYTNYIPYYAKKKKNCLK